MGGSYSFMPLKSIATKGALALVMTGACVLGATSSAGADPNAPYIGYGYTTSGDGVWCVQYNLNWIIAHHSFSSADAPPYRTLSQDGRWGPRTDANVRWFQRWYGDLGVDGVVGNGTGTALLVSGDLDYNGDPWKGPGYCYWKMPGAIAF